MNKSLLVAATTAFAFASIAAAPPGARAKTPLGPGYHEVTLVMAGGSGVPVESKILLDTPHLELTSVTLRQGASVAEHSSPMQVTIQAVAGAGTVKMGEKSARVEVGKMVVLAPGMPHAVVADEKTDLILLVHHIKGGGPAGRGPR